METNEYLIKIKNYVELNTPVEFTYDLQKYVEIMDRLIMMNLSNEKIKIVAASYCLFYTGLEYHKKASISDINQSYNILIGDYISSYVTEILYSHKMVKLLKTFSKNAKIIMLNYLNNIYNDNLLEQLLANID